MSRKFYFSFLALALTLAATVAFVVGHNRGARAASTNAALAALPASDFVISVDVQRALNETLTNLLAGNPALLAKMNAKLDEFQTKTGINPRSFESVAIGGRFSSAKPRSSRTVVIARGSFNSDEVLQTAFAKAQAEGKNFQKEEQLYEGKRIFLVSGRHTSQKNSGDDGKPATASPHGNELRSDRMAVTALDNNTLAIGDLDGVRAAIDASMGRDRVDEELVRLATETPNAIVGFSGKIPQGAGAKVPDNAFEKYLASVRQFYGSFSLDGTDADGLVALRTETVEQASDIGQSLNTLKALSGFGFSRSGGSAKENSIADVLKGLTITTQGNEVRINVKIPQASVAPLVRTF